MLRVGLLITDSLDGRIRFKEYEAAARLLNISLQSLEIRTHNPDFEAAFQAAIKEHAKRKSLHAGVAYSSLIGKRIADLGSKAPTAFNVRN